MQLFDALASGEEQTGKERDSLGAAAINVPGLQLSFILPLFLSHFLPVCVVLQSAHYSSPTINPLKT